MRGNSEICMLTVGDSEQDMFKAVCDGIDGLLMEVMAVMAVMAPSNDMSALLGALFATVCLHHLLSSAR
jgi:hypothetical protein